MKNKFKLFLIVTMLNFASFCFAGCNLLSFNQETQSVQLQTPSAPVITQSNSETFVTVNQIDNASAYQFSINGILFTCSNNSLNCTNVLTEVGEYKFKVVALGINEYANSKTSAETIFTVTKKLETPILSIQNNTLTWTNIINADEYSIYVNSNLLTITASTSLNLSSEDYSSILTDGNEYEFTVVANQNGYYTASNISNSVSYKVLTTLDCPSAISITKHTSDYILNWNNVSNAVAYVVELDNIIIADNVPNCSLNVTEYIKNAQDYSFRVKAISFDELYLSSSYSNTYVYKNYIKLQTPEIAHSMYTTSVQINWNAIENANTYSVYINNTLYPRDVSQTQDSLVTVNITKDYLSTFTKPLQFKVVANGHSNYTSSDFSNLVTISRYEQLSAPNNLTVEEEGEYISLYFSPVSYAETYSVVITDSSNTYTKITSSHSVDLTDVINVPEDYYIKVKCNSTKYFEESKFSTTYNYSNFVQLNSPTNFSAILKDNIVELYWDTVDNAIGYKLTLTSCQDNTTTQYAIESPEINSCTFELEEGGNYAFSIIALGKGYYKDSLSSALLNITYRQKLDTPSGLKIQNKSSNSLTLEWNAVESAIGYKFIVNDGTNSTQYTTENTYYTIDISDFEDGIYTFQVAALADEANSFFTDSSLSASLAYRVGDIVLGETYYYHGEEKDFVIENQDELNHVVSYALLYQIEKLELEVYLDYQLDLPDEYYYIDYASRLLSDTSTYTQTDKTIKNEILSALFSYNRDMGGWKSMSYSINKNILKIYLSYHSNPDPSIKSSQEYYDKGEQFAPYTVEEKGFTPRSKDFNEFEIDKLTETVAVSTSNQLVEQVAYLNRKPVFEYENSQAEAVYNIARNILCEIISDEMSDYQKVAAIYDYLVYKITYDTAAVNNADGLSNFNDYYAYYAEGVFFNNIAVCNGIAKAFTLMCAIEGINCRHVLGALSGGGHAWNKVELDNKWYVIDATNGSISGRIVAHNTYFMVTDEYIADCEFEEWSIDMPVADTEYDYYSNTTIFGCDLNIESEEELKQIITNVLVKNNKTFLEIKYDQSLSGVIYNLLKDAGVDNASNYKYLRYNGCYYIYLKA